MARPGRPKWAKRLTVDQWKHLQQCQYTRRPTLKGLRFDVQYQETHGINCLHCRHALAAVEG